MDKKKLNTKDGSEFTVFYLKEQAKEATGKIFETNFDQLATETDENVDFGYPKINLKDVAVPYFNLPFSDKEKLMIDDKIDKDEVKSPQLGGIYYYSENMKMYEFLDEIMVQSGEEFFPMYELEDIEGVRFFVKAEDVKLYFTTPQDASEFINQKQS
tara:strand:+ start:154 stop:624 length:471 start_codon:yes stop_codon:yes gene_type:complete